ncbi:hypothetical protein R6U77_03545 [Lysinibacillus louembei]|uniref:Uncharacterized protein n=1 Tax=Lysinibacillus louembei TaxID=1470088 RepID=A0ABZ0RZ98_9BACI|nr:hypothetical protein [Lysinibacillus louembei]WPK12790.1 hypothetical protein R6U77_03545 [Lysinibacillus louembei]
MMNVNFKKWLLISAIFITGFTTIIFPLESYAAAKNEISNDSINMIKQTNSELIYEVEQDGVLLRYEEEIQEYENKTEVKTKIYQVNNGEKVLIEDSKKEFIETNSFIEIIKDDESIFFDLAESNNVEIALIQPFAYSSWVNSMVLGSKLGYRRDLSANYGDAKYSSMTKSKIKLNDANFDSFKSQVDALRSRESTFIFEATAVSAIIHIIDKGFTQWSIGDLFTLAKKLAVPVNIAWEVAHWVWDYNKAINAWYDIPVKHTGGFWGD